MNGSNTPAEISNALLVNSYFQNITQVVVNNQSSLTGLPGYLCALPSTAIDLSNQAFSILNRDTFPCSGLNTLRRINLARNRISIVNLTYTNWTMFDLSSNNLTQLPYTLLSSTTSATTSRALATRTLTVSSNQIPSLDLFAYTQTDTTIDLTNNPFRTTNGYHAIENTRRQSLRSRPVSAAVNLPVATRVLVNDQIAQNYNTCETSTLMYLMEILQSMKNSNVTVETECQCSSLYTKEYLRLINSTDKLAIRFPCSNSSSLNATQFDALTESNCLTNISLSSARLCEFESLQRAVSSSSPGADNGRLLAIILGSILGSIAFIVLLAILLACLCRKCNRPADKPNVTVMGSAPTGAGNARDPLTLTRSLRSTQDMSVNPPFASIHTMRDFSSPRDLRG